MMSRKLFDSQGFCEEGWPDWMSQENSGTLEMYSRLEVGGS